MITPWLTRMKKILMSCINDEKIVYPPAYFQPNTTPKNTIDNGMKYLDDILSTSLTFSTTPIDSDSLFLMKFRHNKNYSLSSNLSLLLTLYIIRTSTKRSQ